MTRDIGIREIKVGLQDAIEPLCRLLLPQGKRVGNMWETPAPQRHEKTPGGAFKVWLTGTARGAFKDFGDPDNAKGDVIDLIAFCRGETRGEALDYAREFLGYGALSPIERDKVRAKTRTAMTDAARRAAEEQKFKRAKAWELFLRAMSLDDPSTVAQPAFNYFRWRGAPWSKIPGRTSGTYRFAPSLEYWRLTEWGVVGRKKVKLKVGPSFPAIVAALRDEFGVMTGVHCTFIAEDGKGRAPVDPPKLRFGTAKGSVIRISDGPSGLSAEMGGLDPGPLVLTEGNEDGWGAAIALPEARVWAVGSVGNFANAPVWMPCVGSVHVVFENDHGRKSGKYLDAAHLAVERLAEHGKPVAKMLAPGGLFGDAGVKDFGDMMQEEPVLDDAMAD